MARLGRPPNVTAKNMLRAPLNGIDPPAGKSQEFLDVWNDIMGDFTPGYFIQSDVPIIEQYVDLTIQIRAVALELDAEGPTIMTKTGLKANPKAAFLSHLRSDQRSYSRMLRIGPSTRAPSSRTAKEVTTMPGQQRAVVKTKMNVVPIAGAK